jgi:hypothetical protein
VGYELAPLQVAEVARLGLDHDGQQAEPLADALRLPHTRHLVDEVNGEGRLVRHPLQ